MCNKMAPDSQRRKLRWRFWSEAERIIKNKKEIKWRGLLNGKAAFQVNKASFIYRAAVVGIYTEK